MVLVFLLCFICFFDVFAYPEVADPIADQQVEVWNYYDFSISTQTFNQTLTDTSTLVVKIGSQLPEWLTERVASANITSYLEGNFTGMDVKGSHIYMIDNTTFYAVAVTDKENPLISEIHEHVTGGLNSLTVEGSMAFLTVESYGILLIRSITTNPTEKSRLELPGNPRDSVKWLDYLYVANEGLQVIDVSNTALPSLEANFDTGNNNSNQVLVFELLVDPLNRTFCFLSEGEDGILIFDVTDSPQTPENITHIDVTSIRMDFFDDHLYVVTGSELLIFDVGNITIPRLVGSMDTPLGSKAVVAAKNLTYILEGNMMKILDSQFFSDLKELSSLELIFGEDQQQLDISGNFFFTTGGGRQNEELSSSIASPSQLTIGSFGNLEIYGTPLSEDCSTFSIDVIGTSDGVSATDTFSITVSGYNSYFFDDQCSVFLCNGEYSNDSTDVCSAQGNCTLGPNDFLEWNGNCQCFETYFGQFCNVTTCNDVFNNQSTVCSSRGSCHEFDTCQCDVDYYGDDCEITTCFGIFSNETDVVCDGIRHGSCDVLDTCHCIDDEYFGDTCNVTTCNGIFTNSTSMIEMCSGKGDCVEYNQCDCMTGYRNDNGRCLEIPPVYSGARSGLSIAILFDFFVLFF